MSVLLRMFLVGFIALMASGCSAAGDGTAEAPNDDPQQTSNETAATQPQTEPSESTTSTSLEQQPDLGQPCVPSTDDVRSVADPENWVGYLEDCSTHDPLWIASVTLVCGSAPEVRLVESFTANTNGRGEETRLYSGDSGGRLWPLEVGEEFPADRRLAWQIPGFFLGPWEIDEIIDQCDEVPLVDSTGPGRVIRVLEAQQVNPLDLIGTRVMHAEAGVFAIADDGVRNLTNLQSTFGWALDESSGPGSQQAGIYLISSDTEEPTGSFLVMQTLWEERSFDHNETEQDFLVNDVLQLPAMASNVSLFAYNCTLDGAMDSELVVMAETEPSVARPVAAWRANRKTRTIEPTSIDGVACTNESG